MELFELDDALDFIQKHGINEKGYTIQDGFGYGFLAVESFKNGDWDKKISRQVIDKLHKDGFLTTVSPQKPDRFIMTANGEMFLKQGGYVAQYNRDNEFSVSLSAQHEVAKENLKLSQNTVYATRWIAAGTVILALGTVVLAFQALIEICNFFRGF